MRSVVLRASSPAELPAVRWIAASVAVRDQAEVFARSTHPIAELVAAVKAFTFMDQAAERRVDVHDGLENTLTILAQLLKDVKILRGCDRTLPSVRALGCGPDQVWTNIIDNAVDAMGGAPAGTIIGNTRTAWWSASLVGTSDGRDLLGDCLVSDLVDIDRGCISWKTLENS